MRNQRGLSRFEDIQQQIEQRIADIERANEKAENARSPKEEKEKENIIKKLKNRMKKLFMTIIAVQLPLVGATAQSHWTFNEDQWQSETVLYCDLVSQLSTVGVSQANFEVAAFIGDEVRAVATQQSYNNTPCFIMRVKGDAAADMGKTITFKAYNTQTQLEYDAVLVESPLPITWDGETKDPGTPSNLRHLYITEVTGISLPQTITVAKGETVNLLDYITVQPEGAKLSSTAVYTWDFANSAAYINVENNQLEGLAGTDGAWLGLRVGNLSASTTVIVTNPATALTILDDFKEITVNKGDNATLTKMIESSYELTPADASDRVVWVIADETIVQDMAPTAYGWNPIKGGTTTMTAQILNANGSVRLSATLTVHVVVPVESVEFDFSDLPYEPKYIECNVGDDLTSFLNSHLKVLPEDATDKTVTWSVMGESGIISLTSDGSSIKAVGPGQGVQVVVTSPESNNLRASCVVWVHNPATDVAFAAETLTATYEGQTLVISDEVIGNISFLPSDFETIEQLSITSSDESVVMIAGVGMQQNNDRTYTLNLRATALKEGTVTVTVSFSYTNWLGTYTSPNGNNTVTVEKTFTIVVGASKDLQGFTIENDELVFGEEANVYVWPQPDDAEFDASKVSVVIRSQNNLPDAWAKTFTAYTETGGMMTFAVTPQVPGQVTIEILYDGVALSEAEADIPARFALGDGWQWRTLNYGSVEPGNMQDAFGGSSLVEIRSQRELLYNDPQLGYFGTLADSGVSQDVCYKVKTRGGTADGYLIYGGYYVYGWEEDLNKGWTWIPNPYFYRRDLSRISSGNTGDRIVSKDSGFAEYDGTKWTGSLSMLTPGEGYLYYTESGEQINMDSEFDFAPADDNDSSAGNGTGSAKRFARGQVSLPWQYDATEWRDNMTIVAVAENVGDLGSYSVGAFVDGECRGEGVLVDDRLFITVHGKAGEQVSFRFCDEQGREFFDAKETMTFQPAAGSLKAPVALTKVGQATGIEAVGNSQLATDGESGSVYDLKGRRVVSITSNPSSIKPGIYIVGGKKIVIK